MIGVVVARVPLRSLVSAGVLSAEPFLFHDRIIGKVDSLKAFFAHFYKPSIQQIVRRSLALRPRGAIPNDVLVLNSLGLLGHCLQLAWGARDIHPWNRDLPPS